MGFQHETMKLLAPFMRFYHRLDVAGASNIPPEGTGFIIAANHTNWFGWDAMLISSALPDRDIAWVSWSYEEEMPLWDAAVKAMGGILYNGKREFPYGEISARLRAGDVIGIFPEGNNNTVRDWYRLRKFLPGCAKISALSGAPVIPTAVAGIEEASPIFKAKEHEKEPISDIIAFPIPLPTKATVHFGAPILPPPDTDPDNKTQLYSDAKKIQHEVLSLLKQYRPNARAD